MERHFMKVIKEITTIGPSWTGATSTTSTIRSSYQYPIAYLSEPGYWVMSDAEAKGLREYLLKGGFLIVDDFMGRRVVQLRGADAAACCRGADRADGRLASDLRFVLPPRVARMTYPNRPSIQAEFHGIFEDNDPESG